MEKTSYIKGPCRNIRDITKTLEKHKITVYNFTPSKVAKHIFEIPISLQVAEIITTLPISCRYRTVWAGYKYIWCYFNSKAASKESPDTIAATLKLNIYGKVGQRIRNYENRNEKLWFGCHSEAKPKNLFEMLHFVQHDTASSFYLSSCGKKI